MAKFNWWNIFYPFDYVQNVQAEKTAEAAAANVPPPNKYESLTGEQLTGLGDQYAYGTDWWKAFDPEGEFTTPEQWSGAYGATPVATGYKDASGQWQDISPTAGAYQAYKLRGMANQFPEQTDLLQTPSYAGLQELIEQLKGGPNFQGAADYAANILGTTTQGYQQSVGGLLEQVNKGVTGQQGIPTQQADIMNRQLQNQIDDQRAQMKEIVGALAGQGRSIAAFQQMDEISSQIQDTWAQGKIAQWNLQMAQQQLQYDSAMQQYQYMTKVGLEGAEQFLNNIRANQEQLLQSYALDISTIAQEDITEINAFRDHADAYYRSFLVDQGLDQSVLEKMSELYAAELQPLYDQLQLQITTLIKELYPQLTG